jgi:pimeloyl-ACP methyl ester carboxylesterase
MSGASVLEPFRIEVDGATADDLRRRLDETRWPSQPAAEGWATGADLAYVRELCEHWREGYDLARIERLNELGSGRWGGIHLLWVRAPSPRGVPVVLLHGWPSAPLEYAAAATRLAAAGHDAIVPSLPGYAWSDDPGEPLNVTEMASRLRALVEEGLGQPAYAVAGGDWGAILAARIAFDAPGAVTGVHISTPMALPVAGGLAETPPSDAELRWVERMRRWRRHEGFHLAIQGQAPDTISPALNDSPAGLAAYLLDKYRTWSDSGGEAERRFSKDDLCDFLTIYWSTASIASSMRLYYGERTSRWTLEPGQTIDVPAAVAAFPGEMGGDASLEGGSFSPPRAWTERIFPDLRRWTDMPSGGHFAAFEEPELYSDDLIAFLADLEA